MHATRRQMIQNLLLGAAGAAALAGLAKTGGLAAFAQGTATPGVPHSDADWRKISDIEWRKRLSPAAYNVLRQQGTEAPWSSPLEYEHRKGIYSCAGCDLPLFASETKFESGTGWPSFWKPLPNAVQTADDKSWIEDRTEVHCRRCAGHLGHVFADGPKPTGLRYCMDGLALKFKPQLA